MFEADPLTGLTLAHDAVLIVVQAGPPADLPGAVPGFVENLLGEIGSLVGDATGGIGETVSGLTPGGDGAGSATASGAGETASGR